MSKEIHDMSFEEALSELEQTIKKIDSGTESLESSIAYFERGTSLKKHCQQKLHEAHLKIEKIVKTADGNIISEEIKLED